LKPIPCSLHHRNSTALNRQQGDRDRIGAHDRQDPPVLPNPDDRQVPTELIAVPGGIHRRGIETLVAQRRKQEDPSVLGSFFAPDPSHYPQVANRQRLTSQVLG
jgi:hypothetical protein